jgi:quaternary ammonium compound-resistance protein SugE
VVGLLMLARMWQFLAALPDVTIGRRALQPNEAWACLFLAGLFEMAFVTCMKLSAVAEGSRKLWWTAAFLVLSVISFWLLTLAARTIPLGTAYGIWTGIGAVGAVVIGIVWFKDPATFWRLFFLTCLIGSLVGLKLVSPTGE